MNKKRVLSKILNLFLVAFLLISQADVLAFMLSDQTVTVDEDLTAIEEVGYDSYDGIIELSDEIVIATPSEFVYSTTFAGWAGGLDYEIISFLNQTIYAITDITVSIEPYGTTDFVAFEQYSVLLGVGSGEGQYNITSVLQPITVGQPSHIRLRPIEGLLIGEYHNLLVLTGSNGFRLEVPLSVTIAQHPGGVANPAEIDFGIFEEGYMLLEPNATNNALTTARTGPRSIVLNAPIAQMNNVTLEWASGLDSPFEVFRGLNNNHNANTPSTIIPQGTSQAAAISRQVRIRPVSGLAPGIYEDILLIRGDGGALIEVPVRLEVIPWDGEFQFSVVAEAPERSVVANPSAGEGYIDFGQRLVNYPAYGFRSSDSPRAARVVIHNESLTRGINDLGASALILGLGSASPFEIEPSLRATDAWTDASAPLAAYIQPHHETIPTGSDTTPSVRGIGQVRVRPRHGLPAGVYEDTLTIVNSEGFEVTVELMFEVIMPPADVVVYPESWVFTDEYEGYNHAAAANRVLFKEFLLTNHTQTPQPVEISFEQGAASPFVLNRGITQQSLMNPAGTAAIRNDVLQYATHGFRVIPRAGLPVGTHTDYLILTFSDGSTTRVPLSFTVLERPVSNQNVTVTPNRIHHFIPRHVNYTIPNTNQGWTEFRFFNHGAANVTGVSARFEQGDDSPFAFNRPLNQALGTNANPPAAISITTAATGGANVRVWPQLDLPVGLHRDVLILENNSGFRMEIILYFEVVAFDTQNIHVDTTEFIWYSRHPGYWRTIPTAATNFNLVNRPYHLNTAPINELNGSPMGLAEIVITNNSQAPLQLPLWGDNDFTVENFWEYDTQAFQMVRGPVANSMQRPDFAIAANEAATVVQPGGAVSLRFIPFANLPVGEYFDVFNLEDVFGNHIGNIEFGFEVIPWIPLLNHESHDFGNRQIGYSVNMSTLNMATNPDVLGLTVRNMREDGNVEAIILNNGSAPNGIVIHFESGLDSCADGASFTHVPNHEVSVARIGLNQNAIRHFWIAPCEDLQPGLHEDYFVIEANRDPRRSDYPLARVPLRIYVEQPDIEVTLDGELVDLDVGITVANRSPGYTVALDEYLRVVFENLAISGIFRDVSASILGPDSLTASPHFSVLGPQVNIGEATNNPTTTFSAGEFVNVRFWQQSTLNIGTYHAYLRLGNPHGFELFIPITFTVDDYETDFDDIDFGNIGENYTPSDLTHTFSLRNNSPTEISTTAATLERGSNSPFVISGFTPEAGIIGDNLLNFDVTPAPGLAPGLHYDYIILTGNFGFARRVRVEIYIEYVYFDVTFDAAADGSIVPDDALLRIRYQRSITTQGVVNQVPLAVPDTNFRLDHWTSSNPSHRIREEIPCDEYVDPLCEPEIYYRVTFSTDEMLQLLIDEDTVFTAHFVIAATPFSFRKTNDYLYFYDDLDERGLDTNFAYLANATFTIRRLEAGEWSDVLETITSDANGLVSFDTWLTMDGVYQLEEIVAPNGFRRPHGYWIVTWDGENERFDFEVGGTPSLVPAFRRVEREVLDEVEIYYYVGNFRELVLPPTGGLGAILLTVTGILSLILVAGLYVHQKSNEHSIET